MRVIAIVALTITGGLLADDEPVIRTPAMPEWMLIHKVDPVYPARAREYRIQGTVLFKATIAKDGTIESLHLLSGHPLLVEAARTAARQWIYRPSYAAGHPVRVFTIISVDFDLNHQSSPRSIEC